MARAASTAATEAPEALPNVSTLSEAELLELVLSAVRERTRDAVDKDTPLMDVGIDSLDATHLARQLEEATALQLGDPDV